MNKHTHCTVFCNGLQVITGPQAETTVSPRAVMGTCSISLMRKGNLHLRLLYALFLPGREGYQSRKKKTEASSRRHLLFFAFPVSHFSLIEPCCLLDHMAAVEIIPHTGFRGLCEPDEFQPETLNH